MHTLKIYLYLIAIRIKGQTAYRKSYFIEIVGYLLNMITHVGGIYFIFYHVKQLHGWNGWEILYLYGITSLGFSIAQLAAEGFEDLHQYIRSGEFDQMLTKPVSPIIQVASLSFRIERLGGVIQSLSALLIAGIKTEVLVTPMNIPLITLSILSMAFVYFGLFLANGAVSFWTLESSEVFNAFTYGGLEVAKYPLSIYKEWMQSLFLFVIPLGFVSYLPAVDLFHKEPHLWLQTPSSFLAPVVAVAFVTAVWFFWKLSLRHYQSTGS